MEDNVLTPGNEDTHVMINGVNPYYLLDAATALFDHSHLPVTEACLPLLPFQETILMLMAIYQFVQVAAPSQSGKTTVAELLAATWAMTHPGSRILILSTTEDQANRLLDDIKIKFISGTKLDVFEQLEKDNTRLLRFAANNSTIKALTHSVQAVTGNPADLIICDEVAKWDGSESNRSDPPTIYAECIGRLGKTGGKILAISTFFGEGKEDRSTAKGFTGNFYHYLWKKTFENRNNQDKRSVAVKFNVHVNHYLVKNMPAQIEEWKKLGQGDEYVQEHYFNIPRASAGNPVFGGVFRRDTHVIPYTTMVHEKLNPNHSLFLCFDPGLKKAAVLGQADLDHPRLLYLNAWLYDESVTPENMISSIWMKVNKEFHAFGIQVFCDVAGRRKNDQTYISWEEIIFQQTRQWPYSQWQNINLGIQTMKGFMQRVDGFYIADEARILITAFETGLVKAKMNNIDQEHYKKDGYYEHVGDAARYPPYILFGSSVPSTLVNNPNPTGILPSYGTINTITGY